MTKEELIKQLESLKENQKDFIPNDDTGEFERDCKALELACKLIEKISTTSYNDLINYFTNGRECSECGKEMNEGYCIENGLEYYCSDECLHKHYTEEEYEEMYDDGNGDSYWTEWEC